jgi:predicted O-methyltransferase YrrM
VAGSLHAVALFSGEESFQRSWSGLLDAVRTGAPAFDHVFGMSLAAYLGEHPAASRHFDKRATGNTARVADRVAASYDFRRVRRLVDVGGGYGTLSAAILRANPDLRGVVFDQPHVVEGARRYLAAAGVADRCEVIGGSFFEKIPPGGDAYLLKSVLHDWDDDRALAILATCREAMAGGGTLLLVERVMPADDEPSCEVALYDLMMLVLSGGRERTVVEFDALLTRAGCTLARVVPTPSSFSILEAVPRREQPKHDGAKRALP